MASAMTMYVITRGAATIAGIGTIGAVAWGGTKIDRSISEVDKWTDEYMAAYDHSGNSEISLAVPDQSKPGALLADERVRGAHSVNEDVSTILPLLLRADADSNGSVTRPELRSAIAKFDRNGDGDVEADPLFGPSRYKENNRFASEFGFDAELGSPRTLGDRERNVRYRDIIENYGPDKEVRHRFDKAAPR